MYALHIRNHQTFYSVRLSKEEHFVARDTWRHQTTFKVPFIVLDMGTGVP